MPAVPKMDQFTKMLLFAIAVVFIALMFGFLHRSPQVKPTSQVKLPARSSTPSPSVSSETYPSDQKNY